MALRLIRFRPGDRLDCHHRRFGFRPRLDASTGASDPNDFAVRKNRARLSQPRVHRSLPHVRDDGQRPSGWDRMAGVVILICPTGQREYFSSDGLTRFLKFRSDLPVAPLCRRPFGPPVLGAKATHGCIFAAHRNYTRHRSSSLPPLFVPCVADPQRPSEDRSRSLPDIGIPAAQNGSASGATQCHIFDGHFRSLPCRSSLSSGPPRSRMRNASRTPRPAARSPCRRAASTTPERFWAA